MGTSYYDPFYSAYQAQLNQMYVTRRSIVDTDAYTKVRALEKKQRKNKKLKLLL